MPTPKHHRPPTMEWKDGVLRLIDQRKLPTEVTYVECRTAEDVAQAIETMVVRGAPAIGASASFGLAIGVAQWFEKEKANDSGQFLDFFQSLCDRMANTRPTAVNLFWAIERMKQKAIGLVEKGLDGVVAGLEAEALAIAREDVEVNRLIGRFGAQVIQDGDGVLTHCNTGSLATVDYGTALGVIRAAHEEGKSLRVYADETRPFLQGSRLTAWELMQDGIPVTLITDNMAGYLMRSGKIQVAIVGADRVTANGDVVNKIGTYSVAVLAKAHGIPFYAALPLSTIDMSLATGDEVPIEERNPREVTHILDVQVAPDGVDVLNPAFDVTPHEYVAGIITERGIVRPPFDQGLRRLFEEAAS